MTELKPALRLYPNPALQNTRIAFYSLLTGKIKISISDKITGMVVYHIDHTIEKPGEQRLDLPLGNIREGAYIVQIRFENGEIMAAQLLVE